MKNVFLILSFLFVAPFLQAEVNGYEADMNPENIFAGEIDKFKKFGISVKSEPSSATRFHHHPIRVRRETDQLAQNRASGNAFHG